MGSNFLPCFERTASHGVADCCHSDNQTWRKTFTKPDFFSSQFTKRPLSIQRSNDDRWHYITFVKANNVHRWHISALWWSMSSCEEHISLWLTFLYRKACCFSTTCLGCCTAPAWQWRWNTASGVRRYESLDVLQEGIAFTGSGNLCLQVILTEGLNPTQQSLVA